MSGRGERESIPASAKPHPTVVRNNDKGQQHGEEDPANHRRFGAFRGPGVAVPTPPQHRGEQEAEPRAWCLSSLHTIPSPELVVFPLALAHHFGHLQHEQWQHAEHNPCAARRQGNWFRPKERLEDRRMMNEELQGKADSHD